MDIDVYYEDGDLITTKFFTSSPQKDDVFIFHDNLYVVTGRRWTRTGDLEIIVDVVA